MPDYQQRVIDERNNLAEKVEKLKVFLGSPPPRSTTVPLQEQVRMFRQLDYMKLYLQVLDERIAAF